MFATNRLEETAITGVMTTPATIMAATGAVAMDGITKGGTAMAAAGTGAIGIIGTATEGTAMGGTGTGTGATGMVAVATGAIGMRTGETVMGTTMITTTIG